MERVDIFSYGWAYEVILLLLAGSVVIDAVSIVKCFKNGMADVKEYAELIIKYLKILMYIFAGGFMLLVAFTYGLEPASAAIHGILGFLLLIDAAVCLWMKLKYGRKSGK